MHVHTSVEIKIEHKIKVIVAIEDRFLDNCYSPINFAIIYVYFICRKFVLNKLRLVIYFFTIPKCVITCSCSPSIEYL